MPELHCDSVKYKVCLDLVRYLSSKHYIHILCYLGLLSFFFFNVYCTLANKQLEYLKSFVYLLLKAFSADSVSCEHVFSRSTGPC